MLGNFFKQLRMVSAHAVADPPDHLVLGVPARDIPTLAIDLLGHLDLLVPGFVELKPWAYLGASLADRVRIQLCGTLAIEVDGERLEDKLPGRQGRLLLTYLVAHRLRLIRRDELIDALWPDHPPAATEGRPQRAAVQAAPALAA